LISLPWGHTPFTYPLSTDIAKRIIPLPLQSQPDLWVQITVPNEFQAVGKVNVGVTAGTEGDICPADWIDKINAMQLVIVPSNFTKAVFEETAKKHNKQITTNIHVIPEYFDETVYNSNVINEISELNEITESFAFLSVFSNSSSFFPFFSIFILPIIFFCSCNLIGSRLYNSVVCGSAVVYVEYEP
jgi:hypothetical protein